MGEVLHPTGRHHIDVQNCHLRHITERIIHCRYITRMLRWVYLDLIEITTGLVVCI